MWNKLFESTEGNASVLPSMTQNIPSDRNGVSTDNGIGNRSEYGKKPTEGQSAIWGNLNNQGRGQDGNLDTQGKASPELFTSNPGINHPGKSRRVVNENASGTSTGIESSKLKLASASGSATDISKKYIHNDKDECCKTLSEAQIIGSALTVAAQQIFNEACGIKKAKIVKNRKK